LLVLVESVLSVIAFSALGHFKPRIFLVLYAPRAPWSQPSFSVNHLFGSLNNSKADFRFLCSRNAQKRSPLPGRRAGVNQVKQRFLEAFDNVKRLLTGELNLNILTNAYEFIPSFCQPGGCSCYLCGEMGSKVSEDASFGSFSLNVVVARFQALDQLRPELTVCTPLQSF